MSTDPPSEHAFWTCDQWSHNYAKLVAALQRGEDPEVPDGPFVFSAALQPPDVVEDEDLRRAG